LYKLRICICTLDADAGVYLCGNGWERSSHTYFQLGTPFPHLFIFSVGTHFPQRFLTISIRLILVAQQTTILPLMNVFIYLRSVLLIELQKRSVTIPVAHRAIGRQVAVFEAMCSKPGPRLQEVDDALKMALFKGVALHSGSNSDVRINRQHSSEVWQKT